MKRTRLDRVIGLFSPGAAARRIRARIEADVLLRAFDAAQNYNTSDWISANNSDANAEIKVASKTLRERSRDLSRNNPYAVRALDVIVSNTVGAGIVPNIRGRNKTQTKKLNELWEKWSDGLCDYEGRNDFYSLQALVLRSTVESGEVLPVFRMENVGGLPVLQIQVLEADFIDSSKDEGNIRLGIEFDGSGNRLKYHVFKAHPGSKNATTDVVPISADNAAHIFRQIRPGQIRGVPWSSSVIGILKDLDDYQKTTLIRQKVSACFSAFITTNDNSILSAENLRAKRQAEFNLEPASVRYLSQGEDIKLASPPGVDGYSEYMRESLRAVAAGYGISYEAFSGDYSQVNYSSARMGHIEFRRNIDAWRWNMLIPQFCIPAMNQFLSWARLRGADIEGVNVQWTPPAHSMIDPTKEIQAIQREVRSGFKTFGEAVREQGRDPDATLREYAEWNKKIDDLKLSLDSDPRRMTQIGFAQAPEALGKLSDAEYLQEEKEEESNEETNVTDAKSSG